MDFDWTGTELIDLIGKNLHLYDIDDSVNEYFAFTHSSSSSWFLFHLFLLWFLWFLSFYWLCGFFVLLFLVALGVRLCHLFDVSLISWGRLVSTLLLVLLLLHPIGFELCFHCHLFLGIFWLPFWFFQHLVLNNFIISSNKTRHILGQDSFLGIINWVLKSDTFRLLLVYRNMIDFVFFLATLHGLQNLSFLTRNWTLASAAKAPSPNHWITRETLEHKWFLLLILYPEILLRSFIDSNNLPME